MDRPSTETLILTAGAVARVIRHACLSSSSVGDTDLPDDIAALLVWQDELLSAAMDNSGTLEPYQPCHEPLCSAEFADEMMLRASAKRGAGGAAAD